MKLAMKMIVLSWLLLPMASFAAEQKQNSLTAEELKQGWILLFDGESLYGWKAASQANWEVADGAIRVSEGEKGLLNTTTQFADYELKLDFRAPTDTNSGIFLRTSPQPKDPASDCYELNIASPAESPFPTGSFVGRQKGTAANVNDGWHSYHVTASAGKFNVKLDGEMVLDYDDPKPLGRGFIGLQLNHGPVEFRNIKLRPLGLESIFNGKDLAGWTIYPDKPTVFSVTDDGNLNMKLGPGQLESEGQYADFVLQTEIFVNGQGLNSGIFFRCIPGDFWMGYESQINNAFIDGDRTKPKDCGTGGIYRRQNARRVVANDFEWFHKTIVCDDRHMAVWVNGVQVLDWTDARPPDLNPRKGQRLEKGTIILQGHDPTTDLSFRNIRIAETAKRR
jgi:hypothetical protein